MPGGRPTKIDAVVRLRTDPETNEQVPVTAGEQVIERVRLGLMLDDAAATALVTRQTIHNWRRQGAVARARLANGSRITPNQAKYAGFLDALERAEAEAEYLRLAIVQRAAEGGFTTRKVTTRRDSSGNVIERVEVTETLAPQWTAAAWWLDRRMSHKYSRRVEHTGAGGAPLIPQDERARGLADSLRDYLETPDGRRAEAEAAKVVQGG